MYTAHYNLKRKPFQISSDAGFIWLGEKHKEGLATLRYGILDNKGFLVLTGDVGTGKTTLINALMGSLSDDVICASVPDPSLDKLDFLNYIAIAFGIEQDFTSKGKFLAHFSSFLRKAHDDSKKVLLIIDEAQLLTQELLEEIRLLSNIVTRDSSPLLNIFFVGQYEFNDIIRLPGNRAIAQRITLNYYIEPLTLEETGEYIRHRLKIAGTTEEIFKSSAIEEIYTFSEGFPRKINIICDHALMSGYADDMNIISGKIVKESAKELEIPEFARPEAPPAPPPVFEPVAVQPAPPVSTPPPVTLAQADAPEQPKPEPVIVERRTTGTRPVTLLLFLLLLVAAGTYFLYYSNEKFRETTSHFLSIQEKLGLQPTGDEESTLKSQAGNDPAPAERQKTTQIGQVKTPLPAPAVEAKEPAETERAAGAELAGKPKGPDPIKGEVVQDLKESVEKVAGNAEKKVALTAQLSGQQEASRQEHATRVAAGETAFEKVEVPRLQLPKKPVIIRFKHDSNLFSITDIDSMKKFAGIISSYPDAVIEITGYTDSSGSADYNRRLSGFRANIVKSFLMGQNVPPARMHVEGLGSANPIADNSTREGRVENRRVEIRVVSGD